MTIYKVCFFLRNSYYEQFFGDRELAQRAVDLFEGFAAIEEYTV